MGDDKERGLYTKYILQKRVACDCGADRHCDNCKGRGFTVREVDPDAQYFVLRIDEDDWHGAASRVALAAYAWMVGAFNVTLEIALKRWVTRHEPTNPNASVGAGRAAKAKYLELMNIPEVGREPRKGS